MLRRSEIKNFVSWRAAWNGNSISTLCTLAFERFLGYNLVMEFEWYLSKKEKQYKIVILWSTNKMGFHTIIKKMYNSVKLVEDDWFLQLHIWKNNLDPRKLPEEKVIKTLIYGVKSSGNQAEREAYGKLQDYQLKNTHKTIKLFKMTFM